MDLEIYDSTLRDGSQGEGVNLSVADKLNLTRDLDWLGVAYIEGGWPGSNPKDEEYFAKVPELTLEHAKICAFGSTRRARSGAKDDANLRKLVEARAQVTTIFGKTWDLHVRDALRVSLEDNLAMISDSVAYLASETGRPVFYDAEHFFDGYKANRDYAMQTLQAAHAAGAQRLILCDTNGGGMPWEVTAAVLEVARMLPQARLGIHVHNDGGLAVANTMAAVQAGCIQIQGCMNGVGERCGNVDLTTAIANCELKLGKRCLPEGHLQRLTEVSRTVWERVNLIGPTNQPFVGRSAFAHKGGIHVAGIEAEARSYEHVEPAAVGNERAILPSELSGKATIRDQARAAGIEIDDEGASRAIEKLKEREHRGYHYEAAPASFELLLRNEAGVYKPLFELESYRVVTQRRAGGEVETEATVKVHVGGERYVEIAEGNGPVSALDKALRQAITSRHPHLAEIELTNYKVRILDQNRGTEAVTRVLLDSADGEREWGTTGVSGNVIEASWQALVDSLEYAFQ